MPYAFWRIFQYCFFHICALSIVIPIVIIIIRKNISNQSLVPDATYLVWLDCRELGMSREELCDFMIHKAKLGLNDGGNFCRGLTGYMRLNAACPRSVLEKALNQLKDAVDRL